MNTLSLSAKEALAKLVRGNEEYIKTQKNTGDVSAEKRTDTRRNGQHPYAVIIACSDSRVIPETIFSAGIGELFVIRVAGNVIDKHQLGSIEYALSHLGCRLVVVLGHTFCGAVEAAIHHDPDGHIKYITDEIRKAANGEKDENKVCRLNVLNSVKTIEENVEIKEMEARDGLEVAGAVYDIETGKVDFFESQ